MTSYVYFPGCSLEATAKPYAKSIAATAPLLGIELRELEDWNCCGATAYMSYDQIKAFSISGRNLALAERAAGGNGGPGPQIAAPCSACFTVLAKSTRYMAEDARLSDKVNDALAAANLHYHGTAKVRHLLDIYINDVPPETLHAKIKADLGMLRLAPYYGCQLVRPRHDFDDADYPMKFDDYLKALGAQVVYYPVKTKCCAGTFITTQQDVAARMIGILLKEAQARDADALVVCCPLCQFNLDNFQKEAGAYWHEKFNIPVLYFTQVVGLALGLSPAALDLDKHRVPTDRVLAKII